MTPIATLPMPALSPDRKPWFVGLAMRWRRFRRDTPGVRFERRYHVARAAGHGPVYKTLVFSAGLMLLSVGLVMLVAPGPGVLVSILGAALLGQHSLATARMLDRSELRLRSTWSSLTNSERRTRWLSILLVAGSVLGTLAFAAVWLR